MTNYPTVQELLCFLAIIDTGSITKGAWQMDISVGTIVPSLKKLEKKIGARLIDRQQGRKRAHATPAGKYFATIARRIILDLETAKAKIVQLEQNQS